MDVCDNYRGIAVLVTVSRICGKLVKGKIGDEYCDMEAEEQTDRLRKAYDSVKSTRTEYMCNKKIWF